MPLREWLIAAKSLFNQTDRADFTFTTIHRPEFEVRVRDGQPEVISGSPSGTFLLAIVDVCAEHGVKSAELSGVSLGSRISLRFSDDFPAAACDSIRKWWRVSGWRAAGR